MKKGITILGLGLVLLSTSAVFGQCRGFTKRKVLPLLDGYIQNGRYSSAVLEQGAKAEISITFSSGQKYRLLIKGQEALGDVNFKVYDQSKKQVLFDNSKHDNQSHWDFNVQNTQPLVIAIEVPESTNTHDLKHTGCVSVMVGYKKK